MKAVNKQMLTLVYLLIVLTAPLYTSSADCRDRFGTTMTEGEAKEDVMQLGLDSLRKHNKFGSDDVMVWGYCQNKTADNWFCKSAICSEGSVPRQASYIYGKLRDDYGCRNEPRIFLLKDDGSIKELGKQEP